MFLQHSLFENVKGLSVLHRTLLFHTSVPETFLIISTECSNQYCLVNAIATSLLSQVFKIVASSKMCCKRCKCLSSTSIQAKCLLYLITYFSLCLKKISQNESGPYHISSSFSCDMKMYSKIGMCLMLPCPMSCPFPSLRMLGSDLT